MKTILVVLYIIGIVYLRLDWESRYKLDYDIRMRLELKNKHIKNLLYIQAIENTLQYPQLVNVNITNFLYTLSDFSFVFSSEMDSSINLEMGKKEGRPEPNIPEVLVYQMEIEEKLQKKDLEPINRTEFLRESTRVHGKKPVQLVEIHFKTGNKYGFAEYNRCHNDLKYYNKLIKYSKKRKFGLSKKLAFFKTNHQNLAICVKAYENRYNLMNQLQIPILKLDPDDDQEKISLLKEVFRGVLMSFSIIHSNLEIYNGDVNSENFIFECNNCVSKNKKFIPKKFVSMVNSFEFAWEPKKEKGNPALFYQLGVSPSEVSQQCGEKIDSTSKAQLKCFQNYKFDPDKKEESLLIGEFLKQLMNKYTPYLKSMNQFLIDSSIVLQKMTEKSKDKRISVSQAYHELFFSQLNSDPENDIDL